MPRQNKTQPTDSSPISFISKLDDEQQRQDSLWLLDMMSDVTDAEPVMWGGSIIGFGDNSYTTSDGVERGWFHLGFSPRKGKLSLYIMGGFDEYADESGFEPQKYLEKLGSHSTGKSCLYIKKLDDIDRDVLRQLVESSYQLSSNNK